MAKTHVPTKEEIQELKGFYREMFLIRRFEEAAAKAYSSGKIGGFCHLYIGQEAVVNAIRHASPAQVSVELEFANTRLVLRVRRNSPLWCTATPQLS